MTTVARFALVTYGLGLFGFGVLFLFAPRAISTLVEVELPTAISRMEIRGVYGGLFLGIGGLLVLCAWDASLLRAGLVALAATMGGLTFGRSVGLVTDGRANAFLYGLLALEVVGTAVALAALRALPA